MESSRPRIWQKLWTVETVFLTLNSTSMVADVFHGDDARGRQRLNSPAAGSEKCFHGSQTTRLPAVRCSAGLGLCLTVQYSTDEVLFGSRVSLPIKPEFFDQSLFQVRILLPKLSILPK